MGYELFHSEKIVSAAEWARYRNEPGFLQHLRNTAAHALADRIMATALYRRFDPVDKVDPIRHRWTVGIQNDMSELEARTKEVEAAFARGMMVAAAVAMDRARAYAAADGNLGLLLSDAILDAAKAIERAAERHENATAAPPLSP